MDVGQLVVNGILDIVYALLVIAAGVLPAYFVARIEVMKFRDPQYLKEAGVIIRKITALDSVAEVIGRYNGGDIYRYVVFKGIPYYYDRIVPVSYKRRLQQNELYMDPGVIYLAN